MRPTRIRERIMKIVNIDATDGACNKLYSCNCLEFVLDVVGSLKFEVLPLLHRPIDIPHHGETPVELPLSPIHKFEKESYENVFNLLHTIPIYLRNNRLSAAPNRTLNDILDGFGAYRPNRENGKPYVELYVDDILSCANGNDEFKWLFTQTLIHELAHAALDINNCERYDNATEKLSYEEKFSEFREESMANAVALRIISDYGDTDFFNFSEQFKYINFSAHFRQLRSDFSIAVKRHDEYYELGLNMIDFNNSDFRSVMDGKRNGVNKILQEAWLKEVPRRPGFYQNWNNTLSASTVYKYDDFYYYSANSEYLVLEIIQNYIKQNSPMSLKQLRSAFPYYEIQGNEQYHLLTPDLSDSDYVTADMYILHLSDGDYALYRHWNDDELAYFVWLAKCQGFEITRIDNY